MKIKHILLAALPLSIAACSGSNVIERTDYIESRTLPILTLPDDMDFVELNPAFPVPELPANSASIEGLTAEELEQIKTAPNLLQIPAE